MQKDSRLARPERDCGGELEVQRAGCRSVRRNEAAGGARALHRRGQGHSAGRLGRVDQHESALKSTYVHPRRRIDQVAHPLGERVERRAEREGFAEQVLNAILTFSLYPGTLFSGGVKALLFTALPAGIISWLPVGLIRQWDWSAAALLLASGGAMIALATWLFYTGLRRYESGNLLAMRG